MPRLPPITDPELQADKEWLGYLQPRGLVVAPAARWEAGWVLERSGKVLMERQEQFREALQRDESTLQSWTRELLPPGALRAAAAGATRRGRPAKASQTEGQLSEQMVWGDDRHPHPPAPAVPPARCAGPAMRPWGYQPAHRWGRRSWAGAQQQRP